MNRRLATRSIILLIVLVTAMLSAYGLWREDRRGILTVAFLNIGQGDAIYIESPAGNQVLIDGGPGKSILRELSAMMPFYDRSIDVVLATHADQDHVGGLPDVLNKYKVGLFMETGVLGPSSSYEELERLTLEKSIEKVLARRDMSLDLGGGATLYILFPDRDMTGSDTNSSSIVAKLVLGESKFLLTGDSPKAIETYLLSLEDDHQGDLDSDVLKAGHHGSKTSTGEEFVEAVSPEYTVISAGKKNRYGHPHQEVLDILNKYKVKILRTDQAGRIIFKTDGEKLEVK